MRKRPTCSLTETSSLSALNVSIASLYCSSQVFTGTRASGFHDTSPQSNMKCDVYVRYVLSGGTTTELKSIADFRSRCEDRPRGLSRHESRQHQASSGSLRLPIVLASLCSFTDQVSAQIDSLRYWKADKVARLVSTSCHVRWQRDVHTRQPHVNQLSVLSFKWGRIHFLFQPLWRHVRSCSPPEMAGHGVGHGSP